MCLSGKLMDEYGGRILGLLNQRNVKSSTEIKPGENIELFRQKPTTNQLKGVQVVEK